MYNTELFIYPFIEQVIPGFMDIVPRLDMCIDVDNVSIESLDKLYEQYCIIMKRDVEGFVINNNNSITKYVRMKNGKLEPHKPAKQ